MEKEIVELERDEISLIAAALDWYEIALERGEVSRDNPGLLKLRLNKLNVKLLDIFFKHHSDPILSRKQGEE